MRWAGAVVAAVALCVAASDLCGADDVSARPKPIVIAGDNGGVLQVYYERYQAYVAAGATFRIDGRCRSACTLVLAWADRVCITERAALGFNRVSVGERPRPYTKTRHQAWLHRRKLIS